MSGEEPDLAAAQPALALIASGINAALAELKEQSMVGEATMGRGFSDLTLSGLELGHGGLTAEFKTFCERWEWGVRALMMRGNDFALGVGLSAGSFREQEQYVKDTFKFAVNGMNGNPHLTEEQVKEKSWDEIRSQNQFSGADWSPGSFLKAHSEVEETWQNTGYDVTATNADWMERTGLIDEGERDAAREKARDLFEPTEAGVARQRGDEPEQPGAAEQGGDQQGGGGR
ncbi:hypothetical protein ACH4SP_33960 [Streptomyces sp. NPDC021093]|uniref:hypothetical protein n=1 Tax=Streptomyces sp. NPDC021093 TaxID=3365112 RepID=UPI00378C93D1